jgi:hypothetical protein
MMRKILVALLLGLALPCLAPCLSPEVEAATTSKFALTNTAWTSLGAGPLVLTFQGEGVYAVSDTIPVGSSPPLAEGLKIPSGTTITVNTASNVWAMATTPATTNVYAAPYAAASGGSLTWPGTAALTNYGTAPTGTVPAVNAFVTNAISASFAWPGTAPLTNFGNATAPVGTAPSVLASSYQAGTWTVQPGNTANTTPWLMSGAVTQSGAWNVGQTGTWTVQPGNTANTTPWLINENQINGVAPNMGTGASSTGTQRVAVSTDSPGGAIGNPLFATVVASTTGGATPVVQPTLTTPVVIKASAGEIYKVQCDNIAGAAAAWVELFNVASGATLGTGVTDYIPLPVGGTGGFTLAIGEIFTTGIMIGAAAGPTGSTAAATAVNCSVAYK